MQRRRFMTKTQIKIKKRILAENKVQYKKEIDKAINPLTDLKDKNIDEINKMQTKALTDAEKKVA